MGKCATSAGGSRSAAHTKRATGASADAAAWSGAAQAVPARQPLSRHRVTELIPTRTPRGSRAGSSTPRISISVCTSISPADCVTRGLCQSSRALTHQATVNGDVSTGRNTRRRAPAEPAATRASFDMRASWAGAATRARCRCVCSRVCTCAARIGGWIQKRAKPDRMAGAGWTRAAGGAVRLWRPP